MILRGILLLNNRDSLKEVAIYCYTGLLKHDDYYLVQFGLNRECYILNALGLQFCYLQLCLYLLRHFPSMANIFPLVDRRSKKDNIKSDKKSNNSTKKRA